MRILILSDRYPPFYEGAYELMCHQVAEGLRARGHDLCILTTDFGIAARRIEGQVHRILSFHDAHYRDTWRRRSMQGLQLVRGLRNYRVTRRLAERLQPDLVFVWHMLGATVLPILAVQDMGLPTVFVVGSYWLIDCKSEYLDERSRLKRWYRSGLMGFRRFEELRFGPAIMVGETLREAYARAGFDTSGAVVIPNGIPEEWVAAGPRPAPKDGSVRLLFAGRLEPGKGPQVAVQAMEHLVKAHGRYGVTLDIVGDGRPDFMGELRWLIASNNLQDAVRLIGFLPRSELVARYREYDLLLFPSLQWEGLPMTIIEAMAQGLTVIASDIGGPRDVIRDGHNGFLVPPSDPEALADTVDRVVAAGRIGGEISAAAIETVRSRYTGKQMLDAYETYLAKQTHG